MTADELANELLRLGEMAVMVEGEIDARQKQDDFVWLASLVDLDNDSDTEEVIL